MCKPEMWVEDNIEVIGCEGMD